MWPFTSFTITQSIILLTLTKPSYSSHVASSTLHSSSARPCACAKRIAPVNNHVVRKVTAHHEALLVQVAGVGALEEALRALRTGLDEVSTSKDKCVTIQSQLLNMLISSVVSHRPRIAPSNILSWSCAMLLQLCAPYRSGLLNGCSFAFDALKTRPLVRNHPSACIFCAITRHGSLSLTRTPFVSTTTASGFGRKYTTHVCHWNCTPRGLRDCNEQPTRFAAHHDLS